MSEPDAPTRATRATRGGLSCRGSLRSAGASDPDLGAPNPNGTARYTTGDRATPSAKQRPRQRQHPTGGASRATPRSPRYSQNTPGTGQSVRARVPKPQKMGKIRAPRWLLAGHSQATRRSLAGRAEAHATQRHEQQQHAALALTGVGRRAASARLRVSDRLRRRLPLHAPLPRSPPPLSASPGMPGMPGALAPGDAPLCAWPVAPTASSPPRRLASASALCQVRCTLSVAYTLASVRRSVAGLVGSSLASLAFLGTRSCSLGFELFRLLFFTLS